MSTFLTYPLAGFVTIDIIMNHYILKDRKPKHPHMIEYTVRLLFVLLGTLNAMALPYLGPLVAVVGAFCVSIINLIFPAIIELCLRYNVSYGLLKWRLYKNFLMILAGSIILFSGTYSAIRIMVREYGTAFPRAPDNEYIEPNITTPAE
ncbi:glutamate transporter polyphemus-like isoform X2 [Scaptodrosophila lebanonensis]|nr:glutamate transporter polyphemus-like isoform X2 [Scaptodrosophila lebanonensis]